MRKIIVSPAVGDGKMWHGYHLKALNPGFLAVPNMYGRIYFSREGLASEVDFWVFRGFRVREAPGVSKKIGRI